MAAGAAAYSVLIPVYKGDLPGPLKFAVESMMKQTIKPDEIVIAVDGPIGSELEAVIAEFERQNGEVFSVYRYDVNEGLGKLLNKTVPLCRNEYIARMDADDYSRPERMERQFAVLRECQEIDVVGCNVDEFSGSIDNVIARVILPETPDEVYAFAKKRCPIRHPALLFRKSDVLKIGNYNVQDRVQDYDLIVRMLQNGLKVYNIQQPLVLIRISEDFYRRRGGLRYLKCIYTTKKNFLKSGFMSLGEFIVSFGGHALVILMPSWLRGFIYNKFLRKKAA
ncbi:MAG: glycosyltransferase [Synergistaceae bacterium]|jgi:glycosyltransferase involved in cell wall biosynthesis|nr:glycosyltransferase [Synergistaceae bacterium]